MIFPHGPQIRNGDFGNQLFFCVPSENKSCNGLKDKVNVHGMEITRTFLYIYLYLKDTTV